MLVRRSSGHRLAEVRRRLLYATDVSKREPHRHIGALLRDSISIVMARKEPERVSQPMSRIEEYTSISRTCCFVVAKEPGVLTELVQHLSRCNRTKPHEATLNSLLGILSNLCRCDELLPDVFQARGGVVVLTEKLQTFRDFEVWTYFVCGIRHALFFFFDLLASRVSDRPSRQARQPPFNACRLFSYSSWRSSTGWHLPRSMRWRCQDGPSFFRHGRPSRQCCPAKLSWS